MLHRHFGIVRIPELNESKTVRPPIRCWMKADAFYEAEGFKNLPYVFFCQINVNVADMKSCAVQFRLSAQTQRSLPETTR